MQCTLTLWLWLRLGGLCDAELPGETGHPAWLAQRHQAAGWESSVLSPRAWQLTSSTHSSPPWEKRCTGPSRRRSRVSQTCAGHLSPRIHSDALRLTAITLVVSRKIIYLQLIEENVICNVIDMRVMKLVFTAIGPVLLLIFNKSIVSKTVPDS